jgi:hypothetical protein
MIWQNSCVEVSKEPLEFAFKKDLYIWRPGATEPEVRAQWSSTDDGVSGPRAFEVLNELGGEGWELVAHAILESVVGPSQYSGWPEVGYPVVLQWTLKRPI